MSIGKAPSAFAARSDLMPDLDPDIHALAEIETDRSKAFMLQHSTRENR